MFKNLAKKCIRSKPVQALLAADIVFNQACKNSVVILLYHDVSEHPGEFSRIYNLNVPPNVFDQQIKILSKLFNVITPQQLIAGEYETPAALITFDDGMVGYFENAVPIMKLYQCPSTVFLNMGPVNGDIFWAGLVTYLCEYDQRFLEALIDYYKGAVPKPHHLYCARQMVEEYLAENDQNSIYQAARNFYGGFATRQHLDSVDNDELVYFGNHLYNHYNATMLFDNELKESYLKNRDELLQFNNSVELFSYPFGQPGSCYNQNTDSLISDCGSQKLFTAKPAVNSDMTRNIMHRIPLIGDMCFEQDIKSVVSYWKLRRFIDRD
ncbi:MAG: polysaccharide deacetylase family protein [Chloroflexi bacterium]|nr:polysaccharide deacetylase family protein [Chloroflexota bacterium]